MITIKKASQKDIPILSRKLLTLLEDKTSKLYQDNVVKFGIPEEYVKKAFAEKTLLNASVSGKVTFYLALENNEITGFAQTTQQDDDTTELDRILVFPRYARKGIGTQLLKQAIADQRHEEVKTIIVKAGKEETHARQFYEENGFKEAKEETLEAPWGKKLDLVIYQFELMCAHRHTGK